MHSTNKNIVYNSLDFFLSFIKIVTVPLFHNRIICFKETKSATMNIFRFFLFSF